MESRSDLCGSVEKMTLVSTPKGKDGRTRFAEGRKKGALKLSFSGSTTNTGSGDGLTMAASDEDSGIGSAESSWTSPEYSFASLKESQGLVYLADLRKVDLLLPWGSQVKHLIYGEGYDGVCNRIGKLEDLSVILERARNLESLEFRGFWDLTVFSVNHEEPLLPTLQIKKLVLPIKGKCLDRMGKIICENTGQYLETLECPPEFLETCDPLVLLSSIPNLKNLKVLETTLDALANLLQVGWQLERLELGDFRVTDGQQGIHIDLLGQIMLGMGCGLQSFGYSFPVITENGSLLEKDEVAGRLRGFLPMKTAEIYCLRVGQMQMSQLQISLSPAVLQHYSELVGRVSE